MQKGHIYRKGKSWLLGFNVKIEQDGEVKWVRRAKKLAPVSDKYRTPASVQHIANEILAPQNVQRVRAEGTQTVVQFIEHVYLPFVKQTLRPSTHDIYQTLYEKVKPHLGDFELREFDVPTADRVLHDVLEKRYAHTTHMNIRNLLSGVFRYALRMGAIRHGNPIRDVVIPKGKPMGHCHAYSIDEIQTMLKVLPEPARTAVLVAALTGIRHSEIRGLKWEDIVGDELYVRRSVWNTHVGDTKTAESNAPVPLLPVLSKALKRHRKTSHCEYIFAGRSSKPLVLANIVRRDIKPALAKTTVKWQGWHGFRRGLGTNLYTLGVKDKVIQQILRHANVSTTRDIYIKTNTAQAQAAMKKFEKVFGR